MSQTLLEIAADFETQLAVPVSISDTTASLVSVADADGNTLPNGKYGLTIDNGSSTKEYIICDLSGVNLTNIVSITRQGVSSSGFARAHRRGAKVIITNWAILKRMLDNLDGTTGFDSGVKLGYDADPVMTSGDLNKFATVKYVNDTAVAGAPDASDSIKGITKLSVAAASPTDPIAVGDNDGRVPTQGENDALVGTLGSPGTNNKYVTDSDTSNGVDQEQTTQDANTAFGEADSTGQRNEIAQSFIAKKNDLVGIALKKIADTGTFTGDVTITLESDSSGSPDGVALATASISNANWALIPDGAEFFAQFAAQYSATIGTTYWIVCSASTADNSNHPNVGTNSAGGYADGSVKFNNTTDGWTDVATIDLFFRVLTDTADRVARANSNGQLTGSLPYCEDVGTTDAYYGVVHGVTSYYEGLTLAVKVATANTGAATLNVNGLGAKTIKKLSDQDLITGDVEADQILVLSYDGTNFQMQSQAAQISVQNIQDFDNTSDTVANAAETTIYTYSVPGGTLGTDNALRLTIFITDLDIGSSDTNTFRFKYGSKTLLLQITNDGSNLSNATGRIEFLVVADGATNSQQLYASFVAGDSGTLAPAMAIKTAKDTGSINSTSNQNLVVTVQNNAGSGNSITTDGYFLEKLNA